MPVPRIYRIGWTLSALVVLLLLQASGATAARPERADSDKYAARLMDENSDPSGSARSKLSAINQREGLPVEVERRLTAFLVQPTSPSPVRSAIKSQIALVFESTRAESGAIDEIIRALTGVLATEPLAEPRSAAAQALWVISQHSQLPESTMAVIERAAFLDPDRQARINATHALIHAGVKGQTKERLSDMLMDAVALDVLEFAAPEPRSYETVRQQSAMLHQLLTLHSPVVPDAVFELWVDKASDGDMFDSAIRSLQSAVQHQPLPPASRAKLQTFAEREQKGMTPGRRRTIYELLEASRRFLPGPRTGDPALAETFVRSPRASQRRSAGYELLGLAQISPLNEASTTLIRGVASSGEDRELRELAIEILIWSAAEEFREDVHRYLDGDQFDHLLLMKFLGRYGYERWIREYAADRERSSEVRSAALSYYSKSGYPVPDDLIALMTSLAVDDDSYEVRQAAGDALHTLGEPVPWRTVVESHDNQAVVLVYLWFAAVAAFILSGLVGIAIIGLKWSTMRRKDSVIAILGWLLLVVVGVPVIGYASLLWFQHGGATPTVFEMFLKLLPTYSVSALFALFAFLLWLRGVRSSAL